MGRPPAGGNRVTRRPIRELLTFDAAEAEELAARHGDAEVVWLDATEHIDLDDVDRFVGAAVGAIVAFLSDHLGPTREATAPAERGR